MLERVTLQNEFYNIFACISVIGSRWSLVCAGRILLESLLREK